LARLLQLTRFTAAISLISIFNWCSLSLMSDWPICYQYEGAVNEGQRGPTIWDTLTRRPGMIMSICCKRCRNEMLNLSRIVTPEHIFCRTGDRFQQCRCCCWSLPSLQGKLSMIEIFLCFLLFDFVWFNSFNCSMKAWIFWEFFQAWVNPFIQELLAFVWKVGYLSMGHLLAILNL